MRKSGSALPARRGCPASTPTADAKFRLRQNRPVWSSPWVRGTWSRRIWPATMLGLAVCVAATRHAQIQSEPPARQGPKRDKRHEGQNSKGSFCDLWPVTKRGASLCVGVRLPNLAALGLVAGWWGLCMVSVTIMFASAAAVGAGV